MKSIWMSLLFSLAIAIPAGAQLPDPDPIPIDEPEIDDSNLDDPIFDDPAISDPDTSVEDLPRYQRVPTDKKLTVKEIFDIMDSDKNGEIDPAEWRQQSMTIFFVRDANEDTVIERDEAPGLSQEAFDEIDLDGNGVISGYEFNQSKLNSFEAADANKDGVVTIDEFTIFLRQFSGPGTQ